MYINVGAYVGEGTMVDSHALVGSCAQIGRRVHLSAAAQIGGVLEPAGALPVIIEDEVLVGGNCGVYEGTIVRERAVLAPGTLLTGGTAVFDLVHDRVYRREGDRPLEIPAGAVVVPGTRPVRSGAGRAAGIGAVRAGDREVPRREDRHRRPAGGAAPLSPCPAHTHYLWFETKRRQEIIDITDEVEEQVRGQRRARGIRAGLRHAHQRVGLRERPRVRALAGHPQVAGGDDRALGPGALPAQRDRRGQRGRPPAEPHHRATR